MLRPINWPICPIVDSSSTYGFVTLRGGGMFVVNARTTPMSIVAEYDKATVRGNGCGGIELGGHMYINSGGSPVNVSSTNPHHPDLYGFDVYQFPLTGYSPSAAANLPSPLLLLSKSGMSDSHGIGAAGQGRGRYLWVMDRHANVAEIINARTGRWVNTVELAGALSDDPAPDLVDRAPAGDRLFVALRGSVPLSGDPHNARGTTPGLGIIEVTRGGTHRQAGGGGAADESVAAAEAGARCARPSRQAHARQRQEVMRGPCNRGGRARPAVNEAGPPLDPWVEREIASLRRRRLFTGSRWRRATGRTSRRPE